MRGKPDRNKGAANLSNKAEKRLKAKQQSKDRPTAAANPLRLNRKPPVRQNELEMRNEELVRARAEAEKALHQYTALFDFAPIGYFILDERGLIRQANLNGAALLGQERSRLVGQPFDRFVAPDDRPQFAAFLTRLWEAHGKQTCELNLLKRGRSLRHVHIEAAEAGDAPGGARECLVAVTDITVRGHHELALQEDHDAFEKGLQERTSGLQRSTPELVKEIDFEKVLADLSARFVNVPSDQVDREILYAERHICELLGLDLSALWQWSDEAPGFFTLTHLYSAQEGPQPSGQLKQADYPWHTQQMLAGRIVSFSSLEELPAEAARDREAGRQVGIKSNLTIPLSVGGELPVGALALNTTRSERAWPDALVKRLQLVAQIFANALARKRSDQMLRESEERLELAADSAGTGLWSLNLSTGRYWLTRKARELFGFSLDEAVTYDRFLSLVHPEDRALVRETVQTLVQSKGEGRVQYRIFRPDGSLRWIGSSGRVRCKASGEPDFLMGVSLDVTEQRQAEAALSESEARLASAIDVAALGFYELAEEGRVTFLDDRVRALLGIRQGQDHLTFDYWKERLHPDDRQHMLGLAQGLLTGSLDRAAAEYRYQHPQHGVVWINHSARVLDHNAAGEAVRMMGVMQDITERKRTEEALRASEEESRATFEQAAVGMAHVGTDGRWLRVNDKLCAIVGYQRDELLKMTFQDITHPEDLEADLNYVRQVLSGEIKTYSMEKRYIRRDGSLIWINLTVSLVRDDAGAAKHFISAVEDITERKNAEEELRRLRLHLWHADRVAQTAAVTASLGHELNQPLAAILTNAQVGLQFMAGGNPDLEEIREILTDIVEDDKRAGAIISGLRDLLRRKETRREKINLADTIRRIVEMLHSELLDKQVQLHLHLEPDSLVLADKAQVQQVILNLVMNAVEVMQGQPAGQRRLELTLTHTNAGEALVALRDSGPGILEAWHEKVFDAFWTTKQEGLGIGLMISRSIIESHKGRLWFANNPDPGVTFYFTLPLIIDLDPAGPEAGLPDP